MPENPFDPIYWGINAVDYPYPPYYPNSCFWVAASVWAQQPE